MVTDEMEEKKKKYTNHHPTLGSVIPYPEQDLITDLVGTLMHMCC